MRYGSDLELVFLHECGGTTSTGMDHQEWFAHLTQRLISALGALLEERRLHTVDTRLRPSGSQGLLVISYQAFEEYVLPARENTPKATNSPWRADWTSAATS
jgi:glutamate-ammonia-ligase adenylyltransferase